jgi:hypothetical protein
VDHDQRIAKLEQQLRDERRLRDAAEQKAAKQATNARTWRERAEERADRIERLLDERERLTTPRGLLRAAVGRGVREVRSARGQRRPESSRVEVSGQPSLPASQPLRAPRLPSIQVGHLVADSDLVRVVDQCTGHDLREGGSGLFEADVVVIEESVLDQAPRDLADQIREWVTLDARQPLVWAGANPPEGGPTLAVIPGTSPLRHTFDPAVDMPVGRPASVASDWVGGWAGLDPADPASIAMAARAEPVQGATDPVRAGDAFRRHVWRTHHPGVVAHELMQAAGLSLEDPAPEVAAILVSNRPDDLRHQIVAITDQEHPRLSLRVGCHGFSSAEVAEAVDIAASRLPVEVFDLPSTRELGWCLNRVIEGSSAAVLAKIDDDDYYGPGYLVDAVQALDYANAAIVGRICSFTHLEGQGKTVLRRLGDEEMHYDGTLIGATMVFRRSAWEQAPFPHKTLAEDVSFQRAVRTSGGQVYVASRWDFVYRRRVNGNTWRAPDEHFLANAQDAWDGWEPSNADLEPS